MNVIPFKSFFRKHGKKALFIYLCWCVVKGIFFLILGFKIFS